MASPVPQWITDRVSGKTFCDIGGIGVGSGNERISTAMRGGASRAVMADFRPFAHPDWNVFETKMAEYGISGYEKIDKVNVEDRTFPQKVGNFDIVHCTGILYHAPSPVLLMDNLAKVTHQCLIVSNVIIPQIIENDMGRLEFRGSQAYFLPGLSDGERQVLAKYYADTLGWTRKKFDDNIPALNDHNAVMPYVQWDKPKSGFFWSGPGELSYSPYWWMWTQQAFEALITIFRFNIVARYWFRDHALVVLCEKV